LFNFKVISDAHAHAQCNAHAKVQLLNQPDID